MQEKMEEVVNLTKAIYHAEQLKMELEKLHIELRPSDMIPNMINSLDYLTKTLYDKSKEEVSGNG